MYSMHVILLSQNGTFQSVTLLVIQTIGFLFFPYGTVLNLKFSKKKTLLKNQKLKILQKCSTNFSVPKATKSSKAT